MSKRASSSVSTTATASPGKRTKAGLSTTKSKAKSPSPPVTAPLQVARLSSTHPEWPAPLYRITEATDFLRACAASPITDRILLVPDKDADGLCSGVILYRTLVDALGISPNRIDIHLMTKGSNPSASAQREAMTAYNAKWIIVLDQGSRNGPALVPGAELGWKSDRMNAVRTMVVDHHWLEEASSGPEGSLMLNACHHKPVATASLLTWVLCRPLWSSNEAAEEKIDYVAVLGTMGDLSVNVDWSPPFPDLTPEVKKWTKKRLGSAIALLNAPRRTPQFDVITAWSALLSSISPLTILDPATNKHAARLYEARDAVGLETERCTHTPPKFSKDGRVALLRITSPYQVHPSIATRWTGALKSNKLQVVMCANNGYTDGLVNFSCRIAHVAKRRGEEVNIIQVLNSYADRDQKWKEELMSELKGNAFNGHPQASGGIFPTNHWHKYLDLMEIGVKPDADEKAVGKGGGGKAAKPVQKNNLLSMGFSTSPKKKVEQDLKS
ncbi:uncharacterized protein MEPE_05613 [Melanopsichium pennsylvanicum]|uniref:DDH domain-containing protein n=2 Tax=Melanopsichium pennsylvanicum TaxID=63383 RepID=A0AAJ4XPU1_9BASI|nr:conserved hypothetical protein [Melanopsichium pennsylvanicum 4]SNX86904.1 uncharacterized protein MEPE_05613 [Melanopsichium pennsylvanicum]